MSKKSYFTQYSSPNIVIVPAGSREEPPVKKLRLDNIPLPSHQAKQNVNSSQSNSIPEQQTQHVQWVPVHGHTNVYRQNFNTPVLAVIPPDVTVSTPKTNLKEIVPTVVSPGSDELDSKTENGTPKKSWASNYLTSIGQVYKKPIKLNLSSSKKKFNTSTEIQRSNTKSQNINDSASDKKSENMNKPLSKTKDINQKLVTSQQPKISNTKNNDTLFVSSKNTDSKVRSEMDKREPNNDSLTSTTQLATVSQDTPNKLYNDKLKAKNVNKTSCSLKRAESDLQCPIKECEINTSCDVSQSFTNVLNTHDQCKASHVLSKALCKNSSESEKVSNNRLSNKDESKSQKIYDKKDKYKSKNNDNQKQISNKNEAKSQNIYEVKDKYKTKGNDKEKPSTSSSHSKYKNSKDKDSHSTDKSSRKHDGNKTATKFADGKVSKYKSSQSDKDKSYKKLKEIIQDKIKKVKSEKALMNLKENKSDERPDQHFSSDKRPNKNVSHHTKSGVSQKDKRDLKILSTKEKLKDSSSKKYCSNKESEETSTKLKQSSPINNESEEASKKLKQSPPIKSVVQVKGNSRESPLNTHEVDKKFDLRTKLSRRGLSQYFTKLRNAGNIFAEKTKVERDNLLITVQNEINQSTASNNKERIKEPKVKTQKVKPKKYKKVKLVINLICESTESSDTDDNTGSEENDACAMTSEDLSFLDDLNIDEIVDSLNYKNDSASQKNTNGLSNKQDSIIYIDDLKTDDENSNASTVHLEELDEKQNEISIKRENVHNYLGNVISNEVIPEHQRSQNIGNTNFEHATQNQSTLGTNMNIKSEICDNDESSKHGSLMPASEIKRELSYDGCNNNTLLDDGINKQCSKIAENMQINECNNIEPEKSVQKVSTHTIEIKTEAPDDCPNVCYNKEVDCISDSAKTQDLNERCCKIPKESLNCQIQASDNLVDEIKQEEQEVADADLVNISARDVSKEDDHVIKEGNTIDSQKIITNFSETISCVNNAEDKTNSTQCNETTLIANVENDIDAKTTSNTAKPQGKLKIPPKINANNGSDPDTKIRTEAIELNKAHILSSNNTETLAISDIEMKDARNTTNFADKKESNASLEIEIKQTIPEQNKNVNSCSPKVEKKVLERSIETVKQKNTDTKIQIEAIELNKAHKLIKASPEIEIKQKLPEQIKSVNSYSPKVEKKVLERSTETLKQENTTKSGLPNVGKSDMKQSLEKPNTSNEVLPKTLNTSKMLSIKVDEANNKMETATKNDTVKNVGETDKTSLSETLDNKSSNHTPVRTKTSPKTETEETKNLPFDDSREQEQNLIKKIEERMLAYLKEPYSVTAIIRRGQFSKILKCANSKGRLSAIKVIKHNQDVFGAHKDMLLTLQKNIPRNRLNFPCLFKTVDLDNYCCFVMECYPKNLTQTLQDVGTLHIDTVQNLSRQLVEAVAILSSNNIVHSDIKPGHILINISNDRLKLCGFDTAYYINDCIIGPYIGSVNYRAPEIILGYSADRRIDVWSSALVMFEMATGCQLFPGHFNNDILFKQMCTLGYMPIDMIKESRYAGRHFLNTTFKREVGQKIVLKNAQGFYINNILESKLKNAYYRNWGKFLSKPMQIRDLAKVNSIYNLLKQMLDMHPNSRLPIEFVQVNPFFEHSF